MPQSSPQRLIDRLKSKGISAELHVAEKRGHILAFSDHGCKRLAREFLDRVLKNGEKNGGSDAPKDDSSR